MNAEVKTRWINALESGSYEQTTGMLSDGSGFCCLGVLCEIAEQDQIVIKTQEHPDKSVRYINKVNPDDWDSATLPEAVWYWAELSGPNETIRVPVNLLEGKLTGDEFVIDGTINTSLAELNDNYHLTFSEIANIVREVL